MCELAIEPADPFVHAFVPAGGAGLEADVRIEVLATIVPPAAKLVAAMENRVRAEVQRFFLALAASRKGRALIELTRELAIAQRLVTTEE